MPFGSTTGSFSLPIIVWNDETVEDLFLVFGGDTDTRVLHVEFEVFPGSLITHPDVAVVGELDRVVDEVRQDLVNPVPVAADEATREVILEGEDDVFG